jgi:hypothetical protein
VGVVSAEENRTAMRNSLLEVSEDFAPMLDAADGMRAEMERRGWSPTAAEQVGLAYVMGMLSMAFRSQP